MKAVSRAMEWCVQTSMNASKEVIIVTQMPHAVTLSEISCANAQMDIQAMEHYVQTSMNALREVIIVTQMPHAVTRLGIICANVIVVLRVME